MGRAPMSDVQTAHRVATLTIDDMTEALADLDLSRAAILVRGPDPQLAHAFELLGRTPQYVATVPQQDPIAAGPGATPPPFHASDQAVPSSDLRPALTTRPPQPLLLQIAPGYSFASARDGSSMSDLTLSGFTMTMNVGLRVGWHQAIGIHGSFGKVVGTGTETLVPVSVTGLFELQTGSVWGDAIAGVQLNRFSGTTTHWLSAPLVGIESGFDARRWGPHRLGLSLRYEATTSDDYSSFTLNVTYRQ
jgi:hypothetical protein